MNLKNPSILVSLEEASGDCLVVCVGCTHVIGTVLLGGGAHEKARAGGITGGDPDQRLCLRGSGPSLVWVNRAQDLFMLV